MKKLVILLVVLMLLASACASVGSEMARSEEVVPSTDVVPEGDLVYEAFYCDNTECQPRSGRFITKQINGHGEVGCPAWLDITVGTQASAYRRQPAMPIVQQFFVDSDSCVVRIAEDDEYITSQELWLKLMVFAIGAVITIICAFEILRSEDSLLLYVFTIVGMLIMIGSLLI